MNRLRIALAQFCVRTADPPGNQRRASELLEEAGRKGAHLVLLPELWTTGFDFPRVLEHASPCDEGAFAWAAARARGLQMFVYGSLLEADGPRRYNTACLHGPDGGLRARYRKLHLFRGMHEPLHLGAGDAPCVAEVPGGTAGLAVCYDLRFPELFRYYVRRGTFLILVCAQWPQLRVGHWRTLLQARAIENQCFVAGCNSTGESGGHTFGGRSAVVDPWGQPLAEAGTTEGLTLVDIDPRRVESVRAAFPVLADARADLLGPRT